MEEEPSYSSQNNTLSSNEPFSSPEEESGWTSYFEDFFASEKRKAAAASSSSCSSSLLVASSMVSDAASCAAWKPLASTKLSKNCAKLNSKKKKERSAFSDDPLEDTASSPINRQKEKIDCRKLAREGIEKAGSECSELRKKGLCLFSLSMTSDYLG